MRIGLAAAVWLGTLAGPAGAQSAAPAGSTMLPGSAPEQRLGAAPSGRAAQELAQAGGVEARWHADEPARAEHQFERGGKAAAAGAAGIAAIFEWQVDDDDEDVC